MWDTALHSLPQGLIRNSVPDTVSFPVRCHDFQMAITTGAAEIEEIGSSNLRQSQNSKLLGIHMVVSSIGVFLPSLVYSYQPLVKPQLEPRSENFAYRLSYNSPLNDSHTWYENNLDQILHSGFLTGCTTY